MTFCYIIGNATVDLQGILDLTAKATETIRYELEYQFQPSVQQHRVSE